MIRKQIFPQPSFIPIFDNYNILKNKNIGITGGTGVLGKLLIDRLLRNGISISNYKKDITNTKSLNKWFSNNRFDLFFHLAAIVPTEKVSFDPFRAYEVNAIGSYNISKNVAQLMPNCWLFIAGSSHVYKPIIQKKKNFLDINSILDPSTFYGNTKLAGEQISIPLLNYFNIKFCIGRIFSFSGVGQKQPFLVPTLLDKISKLPTQSVFKVKNGNSERDIMDVESVIDCILHLSTLTYSGIINIGTGERRSVIDIANYLAEFLNKNIKVYSNKNNQTTDSLIADVTELKNVLKNA
jgi:dTDP-4-dehydrorhamnose reductase